MSWMNWKLSPRSILVIFVIVTAPHLLAQQPDGPPQNPLQPAPNAAPAFNPKQTQEERAKLFMAEKRYEQAIDAYLELAKADPKNAVYWNMAGICYLNLGNFEIAKKNFQRSEKADKKYSSAINNLGMVYYHQKNFRRAIRLYQKAISLAPRLAGVHANLGFAYYSSNKFEEASMEFQRALEIDPQVFERNSRVGTMIQDRSVTNHGQFYFTMARVYAQKLDAVHCASYLRKSLDEGYKDISNAKTDPAFRPVLGDPDVQAVMALITPAGKNESPTEPGA